MLQEAQDGSNHISTFHMTYASLSKTEPFEHGMLQDQAVLSHLPLAYTNWCQA